MPLISWGLPYLCPHYSVNDRRSNSCARWLTQNSSLGITKPNNEQLFHEHCSAFEISPDHSHISQFPVNCSIKYWSRVLCEDRRNITHTSDIEGLGECWIKNNTLMQTEYMCPEDFNLVFNEL